MTTTLAHEVKNAALRVSTALGGASIGLVVYRRATTMGVSHPVDPALLNSQGPGVESFVFFVGVSLGLFLIAVSTVERMALALGLASADSDTNGGSHRGAPVARQRLTVTGSLAASLVLALVGAVLGFGCQNAADTAAVSSTPTAAVHQSQQGHR